jgi:hypothetical protein
MPYAPKWGQQEKHIYTQAFVRPITVLANCFILISSFAYSSTLKMQATCYSETDYTALYPRRENSSTPVRIRVYI